MVHAEYECSFRKVGRSTGSSNLTARLEGVLEDGITLQASDFRSPRGRQTFRRRYSSSFVYLKRGETEKKSRTLKIGEKINCRHTL